MTKNEQLNRLFEEWEQRIPEYIDLFARDGIINETLWNQTSPKILFICKEPNHGGEPMACDFREDWNGTDVHWYLFNLRIAEWAYGILNNFPIPNKLFFNSHWKKPYSLALQSSAFMNVKKLGGKGSSDNATILTAITHNFTYLHQQIDIIDPDIIILGLSYTATSKMLFRDLKWIETGYLIKIARMDNRKIIDFYHPSSRNVPAASYSLLQNVVQSQAFATL